MNDAEWLAYLDTIPPQHRALAQHIMRRIQFVLNRDRSITLDDVQRLERKADLLQRHIEAVDERLNEMQIQVAELAALVAELALAQRAVGE